MCTDGERLVARPRFLVTEVCMSSEGIIESVYCTKNAIIEAGHSFLDYLLCSPTFKQSPTFTNP